MDHDLLHDVEVCGSKGERGKSIDAILLEGTKDGRTLGQEGTTQDVFGVPLGVGRVSLEVVVLGRFMHVSSQEDAVETRRGQVSRERRSESFPDQDMY